MAKRTLIHPDAPLLLNNHRRPRTRREFLAQSFMLGGGTVLASGLSGLFANSAHATLSQDLRDQIDLCNPSGGGGGMIPFICFDLAGGANIAGSNVLVHGKNGPTDFLSAQGYSMLGLPPDLMPNAAAPRIANVTDTSLGLAFNGDSAFLRGIKTTCSVAAMAKVNGCVIPARSENDTGNNPHNPMYGIYRAGARGELINLIGSQNSDSGGNSMAPTMLIDVSARPTQVTRPADVTGLVGTSTDVPRLLDQADTVATMESVARVSNLAVDGAGAFYPSPDYTAAHPSGPNSYSALQTSAKCEIAKSADSTDKFGATSPDPTQDVAIIGGGPSNFTPIFSGGVSSDGEYLKTASIMKLVLGAAGTGHYAAAGTISMGGFDYHTGDRSTGEMRDFRAGQCMGACLEYAHRMQTKLMLYVFSDGSLSSNGGIDNSANGRGKCNWDSDNQSTGAAFFLVYDPAGPLTAKSQQLGWMRADGSVETAGSPGANSVTQLVDMVVLNYLALHDPAMFASQGGFSNVLATALNRSASSILGGSTSNWSKYVAFDPFQQFA